MRIPVLYGDYSDSIDSTTSRYVGRKLGVELKEIWDGEAEVGFPETSGDIVDELKSFIPVEDLEFDTGMRFQHSLGKSSPEILLAKHSKIERIVDAIVYPHHKSAQDILSGLLSRGYSAIIYGGGSSVSGSLLVGKQDKVVSIDTRKLHGIQFGQNLVTMGAGWTGAEAEALVNKYGYTIGNFPESFSRSTLGGWVSTKATGQESNHYGGIENMVLAVKLVTSRGIIQDSVLPRRSSGLDARDIALGSDGKFGLLTEVTLKLWRIPEKRYFSSRIYRSFMEGIEALSHSDRFPAVARLSDELETEFALSSSGDSTSARLFRRYIKLRGFSGGSLLIMMNNDAVFNPVSADSISGGSIPAKKWKEGRYTRPNLANQLWKGGLVPDTLETSTTWSNLYQLYSRTRGEFYSMRDSMGFRGEIMAHVSHMYRTGACIYFTFILRADDEIGVLDKVRDGLIRTFTENGGSVTHHHGVGAFFRKYVDSSLLEMQDRLADPLFRRVD